MKSVGLRMLGYGVLLAALGFIAFVWYSDDLQTHYHAWRQKQAETAVNTYGAKLPEVDEVRLLLLSDNASNAKDTPFTIPHHSRPQRYITQKAVLTGESAEEFAKLWRQLTLQPHPGAACYEPHHVLQFRANGKTLCETVLCFQCGNTSLPAFPSSVLVSFDEQSQAYHRFKQRVTDLLPGD